MTVTELIDQLDDGELAILQAIANGATDTFEIGNATTLSNRAINYRLDDKDPNLDDRGLVAVEHVDGRVTREDNGQRREFDAPKQVQLTERGRTLLQKAARIEHHRSMDHEALVEKVLELEKQVDEHETRISLLQQELRSLTE